MSLKISFATSYFYKIRFFKKNMIPLSICMYDPKWYKDGKDKNGQRYGLRCNGHSSAQPNKNLLPFLVPQEYHSDTDCECCNNKGNIHCDYLNRYRNQLHKYIDGNEELLLSQILNEIKINYPDLTSSYGEADNGSSSSNNLVVVFVGFETSSVSCSERFVLSEYINNNKFFKRYFKENNLEQCKEVE